MKVSIVPFGTLALIIVLLGIMALLSSTALSSSSSSTQESTAFEIVLEEEDGLLSEVHETVGGYVEGALDWVDNHENHRNRELQFSDDCVVDGPYFYNVGISVSPGGTTIGQCLRADQILLGHDLNLLLLRLGLGERKDGDNIMSQGGVCPKPLSGYAPRRMLRAGDKSFEDGLYGDELFEEGSFEDDLLIGDDLYQAEEEGLFEQDVVLDNELLLDNSERAEVQHRNLGFGFVYRGGFACGWFCSRDNRDARRKLVTHNCNDPNNWRTCYVTQVKKTLAAAIRTDVAPKYPACLGTNPSITVTMTATTYDELTTECGSTVESGEIREFLESFTLTDFYVTTDNRVTCQSCSTLDFSKKGDGSSIYESYVDRDTWKESHGVQVTARGAFGGGYTPGNKPRIFDSNKSNSGRSDMRSPNESCPGGGPGRGGPGGPNMNGENCDPLGNVLIINRYDNDEPEPNSSGGMITFFFDNPVLFSDIGIIDAMRTNHRIGFHFSDGTRKSFSYTGFGTNAVQRVICNQGHVIQVDVQFRERIGITEINFCEQCTDINDQARSQSKLIAMEDFEGSLPLSNWYNGRLADEGHFTKFLGRYANVEADPYKTYMVPADATSLTITMDLYQIDRWEDSDKVNMYVGNQLLELGHLYALSNQAAQTHTGSAGHGITFSLKMLKSGQLGFLHTSKSDVVWRLGISVPGGGNSVYNSGQLTLKFDPKLSGNVGDESFGVDNIKIVANDGCKAATQLFLEDFEGDLSSAMSGWSQPRQDTSHQSTFTKFLGRYANEGMTPAKTFSVPKSADSISISFDFYKIDSWDPNYDELHMWVDGNLINFGFLDLGHEGEQTGGSISKGISWQALMVAGGHLGFRAYSSNPWKDQIIRIDLQVPRSTGLYSSDGKLLLKYLCRVNSGVGNESCGFDNIRIASNEYCADGNFKFVPNTNVQNFAWHESNARNRGCTLASITSPSEQEEATRICKSITSGDCWIGGRHRMHFSSSDLSDESKWAQMRDPTGTLWQWSDGRPFIYTAWDTNEPNAWSGAQNTREVQSGICMQQGPWHDKTTNVKNRAVYRCPL